MQALNRGLARPCAAHAPRPAARSGSRLCCYARGDRADVAKPATASGASSVSSVSRRGALLHAGLLPLAASAQLLPLAASGQLLAAGPAAAGLGSYDVTGQGIEEISVSLGNSDNQLVFEPSKIELTAGQLTKLKFTNPSKLTHYFTALEFADKVYTVLVLAGDPQVEVKGKVQEVALKAGASATWVLVPIKPGTYPLRCSVKGHTEGGMVGTIIIKPPATVKS